DRGRARGQPKGLRRPRADPGRRARAVRPRRRAAARLQLARRADPARRARQQGALAGGADEPAAADLPARADRSRAAIVTAILTVQGLEKRVGTRRGLAGASFAVHERDRIGMIGANGAGKSTLLEMVVHRAMGGDDPALEPDAGLVTWKRDLALEYVAQEPMLELHATVGDTLAREGVADHE